MPNLSEIDTQVGLFLTTFLAPLWRFERAQMGGFVSYTIYKGADFVGVYGINQPCEANGGHWQIGSFKSIESAEWFDLWLAISQHINHVFGPIAPLPADYAIKAQREAYQQEQPTTPATTQAAKPDVDAILKNLDPIDRAILDMVTDDPDIPDKTIAARLVEMGLQNTMSRQAVNPRRKALEKMGFKVR